jgi:hypothetical protein
MATKCFAIAASSLARARNYLRRAERALVIVSCVEGLDAIVKSVVAGWSDRSVSARCAPSTFDTKCVRGPSCAWRQRPRHHGRTQIRSADADVDDVGDAEPGVAEPRAAADGLGEGTHVIEGRPHVGHHVPAVHGHWPAGSISQGDVHDGALLREIDRLAGEHLIAQGLDVPVLRASSKSAFIASCVMRFFE